MNADAKSYTSFWPVFIVFFFFTLTSAWQLVVNLQTKQAMSATLVQLNKGVAQAKAKTAALNGLARDLVDMAPISPVAQQIVTDFRIQIKANPNAAPQAAPTGTGSKPLKP